MGLCDELKSKLRKSREDSEKLLEAVVKGLLESASAEKSKLDTPKTKIKGYLEIL